jgi:hypothetical protein
MDIENIWRQGTGSDDELKKMLQQNVNHLHSKLPLKKLKKNLFMGVIWGILITAGYVALFFFVAIWQVHISLVIGIIFNVWIIAMTWKLYRNTNETVSVSNSLKEELQKNYNAFQRWWQIQEKAGVFVYPIAAIGGFILGGVEGSGKRVEAFLYNPEMLMILGITLLILVPLCYYGARWMFNYAYGKHLKKLKLLIDELS